MSHEQATLEDSEHGTERAGADLASRSIHRVSATLIPAQARKIELLMVRCLLVCIAPLVLLLVSPADAQGQGTSPVLEALPGPYGAELGGVNLVVSDGQVTFIEANIQNPPCGENVARSTQPVEITNESFSADFSAVTPSCPAVTISGTFSDTQEGGVHVSGLVELDWVPGSDCPCNASASYGFFSRFRDEVFYDEFEGIARPD